MTDKQTERLVVALENIAAALSGGASVSTNVTSITEVEKPKKETPKKEVKESTSEASDEREESEVTLIKLTTLARKLVRSEKKPLIIELLEERGIAKISATPKDEWTEVFEALKEIDENE